MQAPVLTAICVFLATDIALAVPASISDTSAPASTTNALLLSSTIPPGYTYFNATGSYYKFHHEREVTWNVANNTCASEGAHLVVLNDAQEAGIVGRLVNDVDHNCPLTWTGLIDYRPRGVMDWRTVNGEPLIAVYNFWDTDAPSNDDRWRCASLGTFSKRLYEEPCEGVRFFTCEVLPYHSSKSAARSLTAS